LVQAVVQAKEQQLLTQPLGFGGEKHDDAVDAPILGLVGYGIEEQRLPHI
jgi:hypothetical protein